MNNIMSMETGDGLKKIIGPALKLNKRWRSASFISTCPVRKVGESKFGDNVKSFGSGMNTDSSVKIGMMNG